MGLAARCFIASRSSPAVSGERREAQAQPQRFEQAVERENLTADATLEVPLTLAHRFNIGSITKEFSAVAIMMLQEEGRLTITDTVAAHLPELPSWAVRVSIRNLLDYTSASSATVGSVDPDTLYGKVKVKSC